MNSWEYTLAPDLIDAVNRLVPARPTKDFPNLDALAKILAKAITDDRKRQREVAMSISPREERHGSQ
jgi:hypothetical protein